MQYLLISIAASVSVGVLLKLARQFGFSIAQAVGVNYPVAAVLTLLLLKPDVSVWQDTLSGAWLFVLLGVLLPTVFVVMGRAVEQAGIVKTDAAQRLSLFLPVLAAFTLFGEVLSAHRALGLVLAFVALLCLLLKSEKARHRDTPALLLLGVWLGYGVIDILLKQFSKIGTAFALNLLVMFVCAAVLMLLYLWRQNTRWTLKNVCAGVLLGCLNFTNIYFYLQAHRAYGDNPTLVFAGMNIGVIVLGTLIGSVVFKEKISRINQVGIALALVAVLCLYYGQPLTNWWQQLG